MVGGDPTTAKWPPTRQKQWLPTDKIGRVQPRFYVIAIALGLITHW